MTDAFQPDPVEDVPSALTDEQAARAEALWQARDLLFNHAAVGSVPIPKTKRYTTDLLAVASFILDGGALLEGTVETLTIEPGAITVHGGCDAQCAGKLAAEFTGGERDIPGDVDIPDGWGVPDPGPLPREFQPAAAAHLRAEPGVAEREIDAVVIDDERGDDL